MPASRSLPPRAYPAVASAAALDLAVADRAAPQMVQAIGSRVWSEDGAEYVDFDNAGGAVLLGHRDPAVVAAVRMARSAEERRGPERYAREVADRIRGMSPAVEACAFGGQAGQALRAAMSAARLVTGRSQVFVCRGALEGARRLQAASVPFDDLPALERLMELHGSDAAALVLAPCAGAPPSPGYLSAVEALCSRLGTVLIFDETLSGFRVHEGGAQALYGVRPDLSVFGESLANGMPLGVLAGRRELVEAADPMQADIASLAAAKAVLHKLSAQPVIATLRIGGAEIQAETSARLHDAGLGELMELEGDPAASRLRFRRRPGVDAAALKTLWLAECHAHRLFTLGAVNMSFAHGEREIAVLLAAFERAVDRTASALGRAHIQPRRRAASDVG